MARIPDIVDTVMSEENDKLSHRVIFGEEKKADKPRINTIRKHHAFLSCGKMIRPCSHSDVIDHDDIRVEIVRIRTIEEQVHDMISAGVNLNQLRQDMLSHDYRADDLSSGLDDDHEVFDYSSHKDIFTAFDRFKNFFGRVFMRQPKSPDRAQNQPVTEKKDDKPQSKTDSNVNASKPQETA